VVFCLFDGHELRTFAGQVEGAISAAPRGEFGFGWDSIFQPAGSTLHTPQCDCGALACRPPSPKNTSSVRHSVFDLSVRPSESRIFSLNGCILEPWSIKATAYRPHRE
jgi:hypothetical protein